MVSTNTYPTVTMVMGYIAVYHAGVVVCGTDTQSDEVPDAPRHRGEQQRPSSARMTPRTKVSLGVWWCVCVYVCMCVVGCAGCVGGCTPIPPFLLLSLAVEEFPGCQHPQC